VNHRLTEHFQDEAVRNLAKAGAEIQNARKNRTHNLVERFNNLRNVPLYKALIQTRDALTMTKGFKENLLEEQRVDIVLFTAENGETLVRVGDPQAPLAEFETNSVTAIARALR